MSIWKRGNAEALAASMAILSNSSLVALDNAIDVLHEDHRAYEAHEAKHEKERVAGDCRVVP